MDTKTVEAYIEALREEFGFRPVVEAGRSTPSYGHYRGHELTVQRWTYFPCWQVTIQAAKPAVGFLLATRDSRQGWGDLLGWGRSTGLGEPVLDERFVLRSWSRERVSLLFARQPVRTLLHAEVPCLYRWRMSKSVTHVSYRDPTGPPRESIVAMLDHALALTESAFED